MPPESGLSVKKPISVWNKPLKANFKDFFKALGKAGVDTATGQWIGLGKDAVDAFAAIGLDSNEPAELAWALIYNSLTKAIANLMAESEFLIQYVDQNIGELADTLDLSLENSELEINNRFFEHPEQLPLLQDIQTPLKQWFEGFKLASFQAEMLSARLPSYFVFALNYEWRQRPQDYGRMADQVKTPFTEAAEREQGWRLYNAWLQKQIQEPMMFEAFGLKDIYVPLRAYFRHRQKDVSSDEDFPVKGTHSYGNRLERIVVELKTELEQWLRAADNRDAIRVISGGPGSGKSSFAKMFAAHHAKHGGFPVLFIPLHQFDPTGDLIKAVGEFIRYDPYLQKNPIDPDNKDLRLLVIFDGLDELAMQGKLAKEVAQEFVREVQNKVSQFNRQRQRPRLQVMISGREVAVQESFRDPSKILHVLPYFIPENNREKENGEPYVDANNLLSYDQRNDWWQKYSTATQQSHNSLPQELSQDNLIEITAQPLLNYLVALSYVQEKLTISDKTNLNTVYADLLDAVYERGYEDNRRHRAIGDMTKVQFIRILEEIALAAWHGDGRTTTVKEIEDHCESSGLRRLLNIFEEGAKAGVTRLLAAFYFRQSGVRSNEKTFEFTHKSFGEYLTACRLVRAMGRIQKQLDRRQEDMEEGWDERQALLHWAEVCGPTRMDNYLLSFLRDEVALRNSEEITKWQKSFSTLIEVMLRQGMPMEKIEPPLKFHEANQQAINSEEALLAALGACALKIRKLSIVNWPALETFGTWIRRLQGQRTSRDNVVALLSLSFLDLSNTILNFIDLEGASLNQANLEGANLEGANLEGANLEGANLEEVKLDGAKLNGARLDGANLSKARLYQVNLSVASLEEATLDGARLSGARLNRTNLNKASLYQVNLNGASLEWARLEWTNLNGASLDRTNLNGASLDRANLNGASFVRSSLEGASFVRANLNGARLEWARLNRARLEWAYLKEAYLKEASLEWTNLDGANLDRANLDGANLKKASFEWASLNQASLAKADLKNINWDENTNWNNVQELNKALNVPERLRQQLSSQHKNLNNDSANSTEE